MMLETFDAQMFDYQTDLDVPMHHSSSDNWFQDEATMEDDEVDMEAYDEEQNLEFEMADGVELYNLDVADPVDVEVYDASIDIAEPPQLAPELTLEKTHSILPSAHDDIYAESSHPKENVSRGSHIQAILSGTPQDSEDNVTHTVEAVPAAEGDHVPEEHTEAEGHRPYDAHNPTPSHIDSENVVDAHQTEDTLQTLEAPQTEGYIPAPTEDQITASHHHDTTQHAEPSSQEDALDPHEISKGVYIDPPPAVFLSLSSSSSEQFQVCLFNEPSRSSPSTPPAESSGQQHQTYLVLLQNHPTLYYESIASVFDALRQEETVAGVQEYVEGELALDAYDLQLTVSEDNIHAREVTLHDLNVLHDGFDMSGPLRLKLQVIAPRFIARYHSLQEQVSRLGIEDVEEAYESNNGQQDDQTKYDDQQYSEEQAYEVGGQETEDQPASHAHETDGSDQSEESQPSVAAEEAEACDPAHDPHTGAPPLWEAADGPDHIEDPHSNAPQSSYIDSTKEVPALGEPDHSETEAAEIEPQEKQDVNAAVYPSEETATADDRLEYDVSKTVGTNQQPEDDVGTESEFVYTMLAVTSTVEDQQEDGDIGAELDADVVQDGADPDAPAPTGVGYTEYKEYTEPHDEEGDEAITYGENPGTGVAETEPQEVLHDSPESVQEVFSGPAPLGTSRNDFLLVLEDPPAQNTGNDAHTNDNRGAQVVQDNTHDEFNSVADPVSVQGEDESDANFLTTAEQATHDDDASAENPPAYDENNWDDSLDGEGDADITWELERQHEHETASNESSVTLSSKTSTKRTIDEVELEELAGLSPPSSPGPKRARVE